MAGNKGLWVNYATQEIFEIDEHERYIRRSDNAKKIGVPDYIIEEFGEFKPSEDRDKFLLFILDKSPLMRVREHGNYAIFEFSARKADRVFEAINKVGNFLGFGMFSGLYIVNHADNTSANLNWGDFQKASQWADKVKELSESFTPKKVFPTIFDYVKGAKPMNESEKIKIGILNESHNDALAASLENEPEDIIKHVKFKVTWDDDENDEGYYEEFEADVNFGNAIDMNDEDEVVDYLLDYLSNEYGYLIKEFDYEII